MSISMSTGIVTKLKSTGFNGAVSDTGIGSCLQEFRNLKLPIESVADEQWNGVISVTTTSISDHEIYRYLLNLKESDSARRLTMLPSNSKNGAKFSGTEVCLSICKNIDVLRAEITHFFQKMLILKIPSVAIELVIEYGGVPASKVEDLFLANECNPLPFSASNLERLKSGFEDYVLKHGNGLNKQCDSCFQNLENIKVGSGMASNAETHRNNGLVMEVVVMISEISEPTNTCSSACSTKTEVLYFRDFASCSIPQSSLKALTSIDWRSYGLTLGSVKNQGGYVVIVWENLPPYTRIDIVLHLYHKQYPTEYRRKIQSDRNLLKKAVKLALDDLRNKHAGVLLSAHSLKICSYVPDLAKMIAGLILSSNDSDFQEECVTLLGLQSQGVEGESVEACIKEKLISVIEMNDRKPHKSKEVVPYLFEDNHFHEPDNEYEGEYAFSPMDLDL
ncbi:hypothetical protein FNV43_RR25982 [Rhamnella rubrinervis]|uniref:Type 2 DNA topoisomerase 6 subunit B-like n=1 Tax=Rhamnella rubrinervis TaxID=2594499 RepID=A0A8K0DHS6_9ROSA|nr:hypothetical protein FNV43_RR25982 [Rhamnella rubrinervis]